MTVYCFDRDYTVSVNPHPDHEAVPLSWIKWIARETDHPVYATGNQHLRREALIPGIEEARQRWEAMNGFHPEDRYEDDGYYGYKPARRDGLRLIQDVHPEEDEIVVVDDINLRDLEPEGIYHYYPWDFVEQVRNGELEIEINFGQYNDEPENANDIEVDYFEETGFMEDV